MLTDSRHVRVLTAASVVAILTLGAIGCASGLNAVLVPLEGTRLEQLATFRCETSGTAAILKEAFASNQNQFKRSSDLYQAARGRYNPLIEELATAVQEKKEFDVNSFWTRFSVATERQQELRSFAAEQSGFGFAGLDLLSSAALPYAKKLARDFLEQKARSYVAGKIRQELMLVPFEQAQRCADN